MGMGIDSKSASQISTKYHLPNGEWCSKQEFQTFSAESRVFIQRTREQWWKPLAPDAKERKV
eukprot:1150673-Pelagomonas_calceolata.AAC.2